MNKATKFFRKTKEKVVDKTSDVLSAPSRFRSNRKKTKANFEADALRMARETSHVDLTGENHTNPIFRARATAAAVKTRRKEK